MSLTNRNLADAIRFLAMDAICKAKSGHPGTVLGASDMATVLFTQFMNFDVTAPTWANRDRFVLSAGHASMLLYALSYLTGYEGMGIDDIKKFRTLNSRTPGHPCYDPDIGVEVTTGALGQGFATAVGMAMGERMMNARFGNGLIDHKTYLFTGDGCLMEGVTLESISIAGHFKLSNLITVYDDNKVINDGTVDECWSDDVPALFKAYGWRVSDPIDGHDPQALAAAFADAQHSDRPVLIHMETTIARGAAGLEGSPVMHGKPLTEDEVAKAREVGDWPYAAFETPPDILSAWRDAGTRGQTKREAWEQRYQAMPESERAEFDRVMNGDMPDGWREALKAHARKMVAERPTVPVMMSNGSAFAALSKAMPELIACSADVAKLTGLGEAGFGVVSAKDFSGRYVPCGIREHAMANVATGILLHGGFKTYSTTYLVFAGYLMAAIRQADIMKLPVVFGLAADSIGAGQNGETHQGVEGLPALRAFPNMAVFRPADPVEAAECWEAAMDYKGGPSTIIMCHQPVPTIRTEVSDDNPCARGAYIFADADGARKVTLLATGSEVQVALKARDILQGDGIPTAVISMPCWKLFDRQDEAYKVEMLGRGTAKVAVEAAVRLGWDHYIGSDGGFVGMSTYGASATPDELFEYFGITAKNVAKVAKEKLGA